MSKRDVNAMMVKLTVTCGYHGEHVVYLASTDGMAEQVAAFFADRSLFECRVDADELPIVLFRGGPLDHAVGAHNP
jgi:hypothetical protein